ncbi:MAG: ATP-dependent sacrificial sulfur transferase LarE [Acidobacteriota bacterium]|jgi:uncharacterized protein|nr:ATP-dependent sacrificial sulfur transferase LarE [Acidobacteriota bacterium]
MNLDEKERRLEAILKESDSAVVAFSGGVDSSYLAWKTYGILGGRMIAATAESASTPLHQRRLVARVIGDYGIPHRVFQSWEMDIEEYLNNDAERCFYCKDEICSKLRTIAAETGFAVVLDGSNADDLGDYRPGRKAVLKHGVRSPLMEAGLTKNDIRELSRRAGLPTADEPASACLATRLPYGVKITAEKLQLVDRCEEFLREAGFSVFRVRHHETLARIEFGSEDLKRALNPETAAKLASAFKNFGYQFVTLDLEGYRMGSANEVLSDQEKQKFT